MRHLKYIVFVALAVIFTKPLRVQQELPFDEINLPRGFAIELYAKDLEKVRSLRFTPEGILLAGSKSGYVYAVTPNREVITLDRDLTLPVGVAYKAGDLYVSTLSTIYRYNNIVETLTSPKRSPFFRGLPENRWHGWKYIRFGPDGNLYASVGMPCNVCEKRSPMYGSIVQIDGSGKTADIYVEGIRFSVGFDWHPETRELWFTDNGRDGMGDDVPADELNRVSFKGEDFGFPYIHGKSVTDPEFWTKRKHNEYTPPELELPAHVAALGMSFYTGSMFPPRYKHGIFIAEHGSIDRSEKTGYRLSFVPVRDNQAVGYQIFASGWLTSVERWGRLADLAVAPDGSLIISDDRAGALYRIYYVGEVDHRREL